MAMTKDCVLLNTTLFFLAFLTGSALEANDSVTFSGTQAMEYLEAICELGPRPSGSKGMEKQRELLIRHFQKAGAKVFRQAFRSRDGRTGDWVHMENLIVSWHPDRDDRVLLGVHYDTRPYPDRDRRDPQGVFIGANDGASGVAVLMELADSMLEIKGSVGVDFVFFDAEEYVFEEGRDSYCLGSLFFARQYATSRERLDRYRMPIAAGLSWTWWVIAILQFGRNSKVLIGPIHAPLWNPFGRQQNS